MGGIFTGFFLPALTKDEQRSILRGEFDDSDHPRDKDGKFSSAVKAAMHGLFGQGSKDARKADYSDIEKKVRQGNRQAAYVAAERHVASSFARSSPEEHRKLAARHAKLADEHWADHDQVGKHVHNALSSAHERAGNSKAMERAKDTLGFGLGFGAGPTTRADSFVERWAEMRAAFDETKHPREHGKFASGEGDGKDAAPPPKVKTKKCDTCGGDGRLPDHSKSSREDVIASVFEGKPAAAHRTCYDCGGSGRKVVQPRAPKAAPATSVAADRPAAGSGTAKPPPTVSVVNPSARPLGASPKGKAVTSADPRKPAIVGALKAATGCGRVTNLKETPEGKFQASCMWGGREGEYELAVDGFADHKRARADSFAERWAEMRARTAPTVVDAVNNGVTLPGCEGRASAEFDEEKHPRDKGGRFSGTAGVASADGPGAKGLSGAEAEQVAHSIVTSGGATYNLTTREFPESGFALSIHPEHERIVSGRAITSTEVQQYLDDKHEILHQPGVHLGAWFDPKTDRTYLDVIHVVHDRQEAEQLSRKYKQEAFYDLAARDTVRVGARED